MQQALKDSDNKSRISLVTGLSFEAQTVRRVVKTAKGDTQVYVAGLGAPFAEKVIGQAKADGARGIISFGVCGGLDPQLPAGSVILPKTILAPTEIPVDMVWRDHLHKILARQYDITTRPMLTVKETVTSVEEKARLFTRTKACAVDMESSILAAEAVKQNLPFIAVRVIHDPATQAIPAAFADTINLDGRIDIWKLIKGLVFNWPGAKVLKQMSDNDSQARTNLTGLTRLALPDFGFD